MSEAAEELKSELDSRELMAKVRYLEDALHSEQRNNEMAYLRGMVDGLKYSIRCNGVSGAEVEGSDDNA